MNLRKGSGSGVSLPEDIIFDVLARLPAKVLGRFRCVCKGWRALISDQAFVAAQKSRAAPLIAGVFRSRSMGEDEEYELRVMDMDGSVLRVFRDVPKFLLATRLDLICVYTMRGGATIINPVAGRVSPVGEHNRSTPVSSFSHYSFGRATPSGAYKVLCFREIIDEHGTYFCEIATINNYVTEPTWRQRPVPPFWTNWLTSRKAAVNGILYFMPDNTDDKPQEWNSWNRIAAFNLESEEWMEMIHGPAMGPWKEGESWTTTLTVLKETLSMVQTVRTLRSEDGYCTNIWVLIDSEKSMWVKQYTIQMPGSLFHNKVLDVLSDGRILLLNEFKKQEQDGFSYCYILQLYNPSTYAFTDVTEMAEDFEGSMTFYTGSLLS
ncbi:unnamed protein product [Urochloa humidicola]